MIKIIKPIKNPILSFTGVLQALLLGGMAELLGALMFFHLISRKARKNPPLTKSEFDKLVKIIQQRDGVSKTEATRKAKNIELVFKDIMKHIDPDKIKRNPAFALMPQPLFFLIWGAVGSVAGIVSRYLYEHYIIKGKSKQILKNPNIPKLFSLEKFKKLINFDYVDCNVTVNKDNFDIKAHGQIAEMLYGILDPRLMNPTLSIPIKSKKQQLPHIYRAEDELRKAGVTFDTGYDMKLDIRDWELDYSLGGAKIKNPHIKNNFILVTVPHAACTPRLEQIHECDVTAGKMATVVFNALSKLGYNVVTVVNNRSREAVDMNRRNSRNTVYRKTLSKLMAKRPGLIIDLHSYPNEPNNDGFEKYDLAVYNLPRLTNKKLLSQLTKKLKPLKVKIHKGTTINDIVTEAYLNQIPAVLIECNEKYKGVEEVLGLKLAKAV